MGVGCILLVISNVCAFVIYKDIFQPRILLTNNLLLLQSARVRARERESELVERVLGGNVAARVVVANV